MLQFAFFLFFVDFLVSGCQLSIFITSTSLILPTIYVYAMHTPTVIAFMTLLKHLFLNLH
jgi:hypothetical protein